MNSDIRLSITFRRHRKRRKLNKILGPGATDYLLDLWIAAAVSRPDGVLAGWSPQDIAEEVDYAGDPGKLLSALKASGWIDIGDDGVVVLHDWLDYQGWASSSNTRSVRARINAMIRHHGREGAFKVCQEKLGINPADFGYVLLQQTIASATAPAIADAPAVLQYDIAGAIADAAALPQQDITSAGAHAPSPSPSPSPNPPQKDSTNVLSGRAGQSENSHFMKRSGEFAETIKAKCEKIKALSNGSKSFNPYKWVQYWINKNGHPQAVIDSLDGLMQFWDQVNGEPWAYIDKIMKTKNGNYHERDENTKSNDFKRILAELAKYLGSS